MNNNPDQPSSGHGEQELHRRAIIHDELVDALSECVVYLPAPGQVEIEELLHRARNKQTAD